MKASGRNSSTTAMASSTVSHQWFFTRNQFMVTAANTSVASVQAAITRISSPQPCTSISSSCGLKIQMKGRITVRSAYTAPCTPVLIESSPEIAAAAKVARPTGGVMSPMIP